MGERRGVGRGCVAVGLVWVLAVSAVVVPSAGGGAAPIAERKPVTDWAAAGRLAPLSAGGSRVVRPSGEAPSPVSRGALTDRIAKASRSAGVDGLSVVDESATTATREVLDNADGSRTVRLSSSPVRWWDSGVKGWRGFDPSLRLVGGRLVGVSMPPGSSIAAVSSPGSALVTAATSAGAVSLVNPGVLKVAAAAAGSTASFVGALGGGSSVQVGLLPRGFESSATFSSRVRVPAYEETLVVPAGVSAVAGGGGVRFVDASGTPIGFYGDGVAVDASGASEWVTTRLVGQQGSTVTVSESVDSGWWSDPGRVFPVRIDPIFSEATTASGAVDTFVDSAAPTTAYDGGSELYAGNLGGYGVTRSLLKWNLADVSQPGQVVLNAQLNLWNNAGASCTAKPLDVYDVTAPWSSSVTWNTQPSVASPRTTTATFAHGFSGSCPAATQSVDLTSEAQAWVNAAHPNNGIELGARTESDALSRWGFAAAEAGATQAPQLVVTIDDVPTPGALTAPGDGATLSTVTPTLSGSAGSDADGDVLSYRFLVSLDPNATAGGVYASPWSSSPSFQVPAGVLQDGVTYYWTMQTFDGLWWPSAPQVSSSFTVDLGAGLTGQEPSDAVGDASVNLTNGNVTTGVSTPSLPTVGGTVGVSMVYNSASQPLSGLAGAYYDFTAFHPSHDIGVGDVPVVTRIDPMVNFDWGAGGPGGGIAPDHFTVRWTGYVSVPTSGSYYFGSVANDGVKITVGSTVAENSWVDQNQTSPAYGVAVVLTAGTPVPITVDYYEDTGQADMALWVKAPGLSLADQIVPPSWLSTSVSALPVGWSLSAPMAGDAGYTRLFKSWSAVSLVDATGALHYFRAVTNGYGTTYVPPAGEDVSLVANPGGGFSAQDGGQTYSFDSAGNLVSVHSGADSRGSSTMTFTWTPPPGSQPGTPTRLGEVDDPVSGDVMMHVFYSGDPGCPSPPAGFDAAPPLGMVCAFRYGSTNPSDGAPAATALYYDNGQLSAVVNPGGETTDFGYDSNGRLAMLRNPDQADWIAANPAHGTDPAYGTQITYDSQGRAATVTPSVPAVGSPAATHSYDYQVGGAEEARVHISGMSEPLGFHTQVTYDTHNRQLTDTDADGHTASVTYDTNGDVVTSTDPSGRESTTIYDTDGQPTDTYGPAPTACFGLSGTPNGSCTSPPPAHTHTSYDQGLAGLNGTWWANNAMTGEPALSSVGVGASTGGDPDAVTSGAIDADWGAHRPDGIASSSPMSVILVGNVHLSATGTYSFLADTGASATNYGHISMSIGDTTLFDGDLNPGGTIGGSYTNATANSDEPVLITYSTLTGHDAAAGLRIGWVAPGEPYGELNGAFTPGLGLETSTTTDTNDATHAPGIVDTIGYARPETGVATSNTLAPAGSDLTTTKDVGTPGDGNYSRTKSVTLPAGNPTTITYYGDTQTRTNPCVSGSPLIPQRGAAELTTGPDGRVTESVYDDAGRVVASRVQGDSAWTCQSYDDRGRPTVETLRDGSTITTTYGAQGNPLETDTTSAAGTIRSTLDLDGRQVGYVDVWGATTSTGYDTADHVTSVTGSNGSTSYSVDPAGLVTEVSWNDKIVAVPTYSAGGEMTSVSYPAADATHGGNGIQTTLATDAAGQAAGITATGPGGALITSDAVTRSQDGRVLTDTVDGAGSPTFTYTYDDAGRLAQAVEPGQTVNYGFGPTTGCGTGHGVLADPGLNSDRTSETITPTTGTPTVYHYCYGTGDQLVSSTDPSVGTIGYNSHGDTTSIHGETHTYDALDQHVGTTKGSTNVTYVRDATGRIIERDLNGAVAARYSYGGPTDASAAVLNGSNQLIAATVALPGGVTLTQQGSGDVWSYTNIHGDICATANSSGVKQGSTALYDPYGNALSGTAPDNQPGNMDNQWLGGPQRETEHETGLTPILEMGARQYDPDTGRFLSTDPIPGGSANQYDYTNQDPVNASDVDGNKSWTLGYVPLYIGLYLGTARIYGTGCGGWFFNDRFCGHYYVHFGRAFSFEAWACATVIRSRCGSFVRYLAAYGLTEALPGVGFILGIADVFFGDRFLMNFYASARNVIGRSGLHTYFRGCLEANVTWTQASWSLSTCERF